VIGVQRPGIVVVGASLAGLRGAEALRDGGYDGPLTIVGDEPHRPYDRPPLSKHVLAGELAPEATELPQLRSLRARWRLGQPAVALDRERRVVRLADGATLPYETLLIATGARARTWPGEGADLAGIFTIRTVEDARSLRNALAQRPGRVLVVGAGLIGCEAASCCRDLGLDVTLVDPNAAGDVARWPNPLTGNRPMTVEHWGNAVDQARHAAANMLARPSEQPPYGHLPAFWSSQFGLNIKLVGLTEGADALAVVQGARASQRFLAVYGRAGRSVAAVSFDQARWLPAYAEAVAAGSAFPPILGATDQPRIEWLEPGFPVPRRSTDQAAPTLEAAHG
jgi:NADPH-dependent 2,4-dienoyl-CoA reductase/sulfur reductase-like enzyme